MSTIFLSLLAAAFLAAAPIRAAVTIEKTEYNGRQGYRLSNGEVELVVLTDVGPRVIRYGFVGGQNLFKEMSAEEENRLTAGQDWKLYGGHRIWVGPEEPSYTYAADNEPTDVRIDGNSLAAKQPVDSVGIVKEVEVRLAEQGSGVEVIHRLTNASKWPLRFCAWALSMMAPGGTGLSTFPPRGTHPEHLPPSNPLVLWRFTNMSDPRWSFFEKYVTLRNDPSVSDPEKIGLFNPHTRGAYLLGADLFVKRYEAKAGAEYPDMGVSYETFTNDLFLELETLGPMEDVAPGETIEHVESWSLHKGIRLNEWSEAEIDRVIAPLLD